MSIVLDLRISGDEMRFEVQRGGLTDTIRNVVVLEPATSGARRGARGTVHAIGSSIKEMPGPPQDPDRFVEIVPFGLHRLDTDVAIAVLQWVANRGWKGVHPGFRGLFTLDRYDLRLTLPSWSGYSPVDRAAFLRRMGASSLLGDLTINGRHLVHRSLLRRILGMPGVVLHP